MIGALAGSRRAGTVPWSFYRTPIPEDAPLDPDSAAIGGRFGWEMNRLKAASAGGSWANGPLMSPRAILYKVGAGYPRKPIANDHDAPGSDTADYQEQQKQARLGAPLPPDIELRSDTNDKAVAVIQPAENYYGEFLHMNNKVDTVTIYNVLPVAGGTLTNGATHRYKVTVETAAGQTNASSPTSITIAASGSNRSARVRWLSRFGAEILRIKVWRTAANEPDVAANYRLIATLDRISNPECFDAIDDWYSDWIDTGLADGPAGAPPTANTATTDSNTWRAWSPPTTMLDMSSSPGYFRDIADGEPGGPQGYGWGSQATNTTFIGGEITRRDYERAWIDHVMTMALRNFGPASITGVTGTAAGTGAPNNDPADTFRKTAHGLTNGKLVGLRLLAGGTGLDMITTYYVIGATANTFQLSSSSGGAAVNFSTDVTSVAVVTGTSSNFNISPNGSWLHNTRYAWPAQSRDGIDDGALTRAMLAAGCPAGAKPIPEGARLWLLPESRGGLIIEPRGYTDQATGVFTPFTGIASVKRWAYMVTKALQEFGAFAIDGTDDMNLFCRCAQVDGTGWRPGWPEYGGSDVAHPTTTIGGAPGNPFHATIENSVWQQIPWDRLAVVRMGWAPGLPVGQATTPCLTTSIPCPVGGQ